MKSWTQKRDEGTAVLKPTPRAFADVVAGQMMLVPTARQVDDFMRSIPPGTSMDVRALRRGLAQRHGAEVTCPVSVGYHLRTVAEAAHEDIERGMPAAEVTPFWRVLDASTPTTGRLSFGADFVRKRRSVERLPA